MTSLTLSTASPATTKADALVVAALQGGDGPVADNAAFAAAVEAAALAGATGKPGTVTIIPDSFTAPPVAAPDLSLSLTHTGAFTAGVMRFAPPLTSSDEEIDFGISVLDRAITQAIDSLGK